MTLLGFFVGHPRLREVLDDCSMLGPTDIAEAWTARKSVGFQWSIRPWNSAHGGGAGAVATDSHV